MNYLEGVGVIIYMIGVLVSEYNPALGRIVRLVGAVFTIIFGVLIFNIQPYYING